MRMLKSAVLCATALVPVPTLANVAEEQAKIGATIEAIATEIKDMRSDIQWLTRERMIDQAINLAREGESGSEIARQTGISADELVAMQAFRRH